MDQFLVEVDYTDRSRNEDGSYHTFSVCYAVEANDEHEAQLIVTQVVCTQYDLECEGMPLASRVLEVRV